MPGTITTASNLALLAPVPSDILTYGRQVLERAGKVAFGSRAWETFEKLDERRNGLPVDVFIYESHGEGHFDFKVSWHGRYIKHVRSEKVAYPDYLKYRPLPPGTHPNENSYFAVFWELDFLEQIPEQNRIHIGEFTGYEKKKPYGHAFVPEGPLLIEHP